MFIISTPLLSLLALVFGSSTLLILALYRLLSRNEAELNNRLKRLKLQAEKQEHKNPSRRFTTLGLLSSVSKLAGKFSLFNRLSRAVDKNLTGADIPLKSDEYIILTAGISMLAAILAVLAFMNIWHGLIAAALAFLMSALWVRFTKGKRLSRFDSQIGDALVIMSSALRSGFSFLQAMDMVRKELPDPIAKEFNRTFQEMNLGTPTEDALENLNLRVTSEDLDLVITAVQIQRQVGGNLAEILDNIANTIRERVRIKGEIKTLTAQGKISGIIIGILPILLGLVLSMISPDYLMTLITHPMGRGILLTALIMELIGILLIKRIIDIKV